MFLRQVKATIVERLGDSTVPSETAEAVSWLFMISITSWVRPVLPAFADLLHTQSNYNHHGRGAASLIRYGKGTQDWFSD